jgi:calcium-translocating P-type ATPase
MEGLTTAQVHELLKQYGHNVLSQEKAPSIFWVFLKQFFNPLIYILLVAAVISIWLGEVGTGVFMFILLFINSTIGAIQERSAQSAVVSLQHFMPNYTNVLRDGMTAHINSENLVPGDVMYLESGNKVPADAILLETNNFIMDESMLTGESMPVHKSISKQTDENKIFAGTLVIKGRAKAKILSTGLPTKLGQIAHSVTRTNITQSPLLKRVEEFTFYLSIATIIFILCFLGFAWLSSGNFSEIFVLAIALAAAAIPEGLPTSITVSLAVGVHRMSKENVIIRKLIAVESLGSCTYIVSDKTGTLTKNKLSVETILLPDGSSFNVREDKIFDKNNANLKNLISIGMLVNEAYQTKKGNSGDFVDIALLALGKKAGLTRSNLAQKYKKYKLIPYESENKFSAGIYIVSGKKMILAKGGYEAILEMCSHMIIGNKSVKLNTNSIEEQVNKLAGLGYKVIALASGEYESNQQTSSENFSGLSLLGIVGIADQLRPEAKDSIRRIEEAGVKVAMVTGDHPVTALTVAQNLGMGVKRKDIVTGEHLKEAVRQGHSAIDKLVKDKKVFAHIEPLQKKTIVESLMRMGHYVAVTGDGVNDAPALKYATIGIAMGKDGTDIARDSADVILTDNNFRSIVNGIIHGRVVYNNIRKVIFLLISTGLAEIFMFLLALLFKMPMPLLAIQLLWLNIIINGIQDEAVAFEPQEGDELDVPPRKPGDRIFDSLMSGRILTNGLYLGGVSFIVFRFFINNGYEVEIARNLVLLLLVLFGNVQALISKSEHKSITKINLFNNKVLFFGIIVSQLLHILVMHFPSMGNLFHLYPVSLKQWGMFLLIASSLLVVDAAYRWLHRIFHQKSF